MTRNPLLVPNSSTAALTKAETTLVAELPAVLGKTSIPVGGKSMTPQQIVAIFQRHLDAMAALTKQRAQTTAAVQTERAERATAQAAVPYIRNYVAAAFGENSQQYASLGFAPRKPAQQTVESKAQAHLKMLATRKARQTLGKVQKAKIHGVVPAPAPAPAPVPVGSAPTADSPSPSPATGSGPGAGVSNGTSNGSH
jgi:hypothetical protein